MLRDLRIFRRNAGKIPSSEGNNENLPADPLDPSAAQLDSAPSRAPLSTIQEPAQTPTLEPEQETILRKKLDRTPSKKEARGLDAAMPPFRTPEKLAAARSRFGWVPKSESRLNWVDNGDEPWQGSSFLVPSASRGLSVGNGGGYGISTPRTYRTSGKASSVHSDSSSTQSTPTKSVTKPNCSGFSSTRPPLSAGPRNMNFSAALKGTALSSAPLTIINTIEVPHFELREDPSFWMDHNVQVVIRVRPLNSSERSLQGYNRCLKQESAQSIVWIGQPEARFTFDHVACETVNQEMLFRVAGLPMVENCISGYNSCMFAYGQTGSGKTYTMLGEIDELEFRPGPDRGMTPRIFEFLFARIRAEEESRRDEKLKYSCRCSFLEIYNEQITDLLEPTSTNLLLREDLQKGVYVENLSEFKVESVTDILKLLIQGAANRKVAATNMNRESSRSHSVFTCVIESRWEKDSTTNLRFARLNLVDLAGSERQKTSGAEGERLKEAANINKSLSTLGHVIMILADVAHGKHRHVPYRDSRLTFLLQDSLGGNSKTMIIANVSPSVCCANETLSTLKFAQRAKLIQNNAVVNEDAQGDIIALQHQIRLLKEELSVLKRQNVSRSLSFRSAILEEFENNGHDVSADERLDGSVQADQSHGFEPLQSIRVSTKQLKSLEATLAGALRREKMAETTIKQLEAEIEQLNRLVRQREEDTRCSKMMLKFREDKVHRLESLLDGLAPMDSYLLEENNALNEEIQLLQARVDRNPEVTRFALENIRLLDQLRRFQDFYEEGEKELLLNEVSELRNQLRQILEGKLESEKQPEINKEHQEIANPELAKSVRDNCTLRAELNKAMHELEDCRNNLKSCIEINEKLTREINDLHIELDNIRSATHGSCTNNHLQNLESLLGSPMDSLISSKNDEKVLKNDANHTEEVLNLQLELDILKDILREEKLAHLEVEERAFEMDSELKLANERFLQLTKHQKDTKNELKDAKLIIEALESQNILLINELDELRESNSRFEELTKKLEEEISVLRENQCANFEVKGNACFVQKQLEDQPTRHVENEDSLLKKKLKKMQASLEKARLINMRYQSDGALHTSDEWEMDEVRKQVEAETAEVIVCLQEELLALQQHVDDSTKNELLSKKCLLALQTEMKELDDKLYLLTQENGRLGELVQEKERDLRLFAEDWKKLECEIEKVLTDGNAALEDASDQVNYINDSFSDRSGIGKQVDWIIRSMSEKDALINELQKHLEDAQHVRNDMEWKLKSLRGATLAITEAQEQEASEKEREILLLTSQLSEKTSVISELEDRIKLSEEKVKKSKKCATVAFIILNRLSKINAEYLQELEHAKLQMNQSNVMIMQKDILRQDWMSLNTGNAKQVQDPVLQPEQPQEYDNKPLLKDVQDQGQTRTLECQSEKEEEDASNIADDLSLVRERLDEFKKGVKLLNSSMNEFSSQVGGPTEVCISGKYPVEIAEDDSEGRAKIKSFQDGGNHDQGTVHDQAGGNITSLLCKDSNCYKFGGSFEGTFNRETTMTLLKEELESALESLKEVQAQMNKLHDEKEGIKKSEMQSRKSIEKLTTEVLRMKSEIVCTEEEFVLRLQELEQRLQTVEENAIASNACWCEAKEALELEVRDAKAVATQKAIEISNLLAKIEEAQETMKEADFMVNALVEVKESAKLEIERCQKVEMALNFERSGLISKVEDLQSSLDKKEQEYEHMEMKYTRSLTEASTLVQEMENMFRYLQVMFTENFKLITCDFNWLKSQLQNFTDAARTWLEETWSEIIEKDCAVSVLHLCHMGIMLERITGLNAENGFLYHGLCESDSIIANLREHNVRVEKELEMCSILKGKLLIDINNSFNRITKKEDETAELKAKLNTFEKKILNLQLQEESMLARSNSMGTELAILMEELDVNNRNAFMTASVQEKTIREKEESYKQLEGSLDEIKHMHVKLRDSVCKELHQLVNNSSSESHIILDALEAANTGLQKETEFYMELIERQTESIMVIMLARDFELLVVKSELEQKIMDCNKMVALIVDLEREKDNCVVFVERMNKEMVLHKIDGELKNSEMHNLLAENKKLNSEVLKLKLDHSKITEYLQEVEVTLASSASQIGATEKENCRLQNMICSLEASIMNTKTHLDITNAQLEEVYSSHAVACKELDMKTQDIEIQMERISALESENDALKKEVEAYKRRKDEMITLLHVKLNQNLDIVESVEMSSVEQMNHISDKHIILIDRMCREICGHEEIASGFARELDFLELSARNIISENLFLQSELMRKDEVSKGLLFDLSLLQESASIAKDQKNELQEMNAMLRSLEDDLASKSNQLAEVVAHREMLEAWMLEKNEMISTLQSELAEKRHSMDLISSENLELKAHIGDVLEIKNNLEEELTGKVKVTGRLEEELIRMSALLGQKNQFLEALQSDMIKLAEERGHLDCEMRALKEQLEMAHALAEENEAIATEARQIAEGRKVYAEDKEEEVKLLEKSVEELECTVYALENKVEIVKAEADRQRLQREELEKELQMVKYQMLTVPAPGGNVDFSRELEEKMTELVEARENIQFLLKEVAEKGAEIIQCKAHISELNMHAEAQAREYKQKFKELESMAQQVKSESTSSNAISLTSSKSEKNAAKSRGSGSPFKCIGLGLTQQINSEKDEELTAAKHQIEELEALAASRQKEIFMLNTRLAAADSMTHDVIRDLLGVKLDMTNYAALVEEKQEQKLKETAKFDDQESHDKDKEVIKLKQQLNEFIEERQSWIDEINQRHREMIAAEILVEKLRHRDQLLTTENDMLKADNAKRNRMVLELEVEIRKLTSQQNLQQRIHHHAKIKEENNLLKIQNQELIEKLQRSETILSRVKEELARYRTSSGKKPNIDFDEEEQLRRKLGDTEDERIQLAQKLLSLCTRILKVAGLTQSVSNVSISAAEDALDQLKDQIHSQEYALQDLKLKCKMYCEKIRLFELEQQSSPQRLQGNKGGCPSPSISSS